MKYPIWNGWSPWQTCSVSYGHSTGVQQRTRSCNTNEGERQGSDLDTQNCTAFTPCLAFVCFQQYTTLCESYKRESVANECNCDRDIVDGTSWYRFQLVTGENSVLDHCPRIRTCGTGWPIWKNGTHPEQFGEINNVTMYASSKGDSVWGNNCFQYSSSALVTNVQLMEIYFISISFGNHLSATSHTVHVHMTYHKGCYWIG